LAKEVMAMSNIRDGGVIILGVGSDGTPLGISELLAIEFNQDAVAAAIADYSAPYVEITVTAGHNGGNPLKYFVVIQVKEFSEVPILCKRDYSNIVRQGAIYSRSRRMYEASEIRSEVDMRELLELAVDKGLRVFYSQLHVLGIQAPEEPDDSSRFEAQLRGL
jgi:predicted HTH transcriptional regulator